MPSPERGTWRTWRATGRRRPCGQATSACASSCSAAAWSSRRAPASCAGSSPPSAWAWAGPPAGLRALAPLELFTDGVPFALGNAQPGLHDLGIELRVGALDDLLARRLVGAALAVRAIVGDRVVGVDHREDARADADVVAGQPLGIAGAVPAFLVVQRTQAGERQKSDPLEDLVAERRVALHLRRLRGVQGTGLEQDGVAHADLADVVQRRAPL